MVNYKIRKKMLFAIYMLISIHWWNSTTGQNLLLSPFSDFFQILFQKWKYIHVLLRTKLFIEKFVLGREVFWNFAYVNIFAKRKNCFGRHFETKYLMNCFCWYMFALGVYIYGASFVPIFFCFFVLFFTENYSKMVASRPVHPFVHKRE